MSTTPTTKFSAIDDANRLRSLAAGMTYNGTKAEGDCKHILHEIAMRLASGGYAPAPAMAPSIHEMNYQAAMTAVESLRAENVALKAQANAVKLDDDPAGTSDPFRDAVWGAVQESLGDAYDCTRVWAAWGCNTMSEDDFHRVADQPDRVDEIVAAVFKALPASVSKVHTWADMDAITDDPKVFEALQEFGAEPTGDGGVVVVEAILNALGLKTFREQAIVDLASHRHSGPISTQDDTPAWQHHARKIVLYRNSMSYNDSYFGEPAGLLKQVVAELDRLLPTVEERPVAPQPVKEVSKTTGTYLTSDDEVRIRQLIDEFLDIDFVKLEQGSHVLHTSGPVTFDCLRALVISGLESGAKTVRSQWPVLKGIGKVAGDGFKDTTKVGEVVYAWNQEQPSPYKPGQYPRLGNGCGWTADIEHFDFTLASTAEIVSALETPYLEAKGKLRQITDAINTYYSALDKRLHGSVAQSKAFDFIEQVMGMQWKQGSSTPAQESSEISNRVVMDLPDVAGLARVIKPGEDPFAGEPTEEVWLVSGSVAEPDRFLCAHTNISGGMGAGSKILVDWVGLLSETELLAGINGAKVIVNGGWIECTLLALRHADSMKAWGPGFMCAVAENNERFANARSRASFHAFNALLDGRFFFSNLDMKGDFLSEAKECFLGDSMEIHYDTKGRYTVTRKTDVAPIFTTLAMAFSSEGGAA